MGQACWKRRLQEEMKDKIECCGVHGHRAAADGEAPGGLVEETRSSYMG